MTFQGVFTALTVHDIVNFCAVIDITCRYIKMAYKITINALRESKPPPWQLSALFYLCQ